MGALVIGAIVVIVLAAFFLPVIPASHSSSWFYGAGDTTVSADSSLTFLLFHCGSYVNANETTTLFGVGSSSPVSKGYNFNCDFRIG